MPNDPSYIRLKDLLSVEENRVRKSIWIVDSKEVAFEISATGFFEVMLANINRNIEHRWILPEGIVAREYWHHLKESVTGQITDPELLSKLQARFFPVEILNAISDFVIYDAKTMGCFGYVALFQNGEYFHFETDQHKLTQLTEGFEFLWGLPGELHAMISIYAAGKDDLEYFLPQGLMPEDVTQSINENYQEALRVYRAGCHTATISLCGRLIETVLHALYVKLESRLPKSDWGLDALASRIKKHDIYLPALKEQFSLIKKFRNRAVHGGVSFPNEEQANAILLLTRDLLIQVVRQTSVQ